MTAGVAVTTPFCGHCGWDFVAQNTNGDNFCDSCGADLFSSIAPGDGPSNPPSVPTVSDQTGGVARASWTEAPNFDEYGIRWTVNGVVVEYKYPANTTEDYTAEVGDTVCAALNGKTDGIWSGWSADDCVTLA